MDPEQEMLTPAVMVTGVLVLNAPTPLQVLWLLVLGGVLIALRRRILDPDGGGAGQRRTQPPTGVADDDR